MPEGVEKLPDNVFKNCGNFSRIILPATLKVIGNSALEGINLERMVLPDSVTTIGAYAFCNCSLLEQIWIGKNVTEIHDRSFNGCKTEKLVIHGVAGSYAQEWSTAKGFKFDTEVMGQNDLIINGKVTAQGAGLPDVRVDVYDCNRTKTVYVAYTDAAGSWSYNEAQAGTRYKIHYSHARYKFETNDTEVTVNENLQIPEIKATAISGIPEENPEKEFTFESLTANSVKITGYSGNGDAVVIPAMLNGKEVQVLGDSVFRGRKEIKTVVLPEGLVEIQAETFKDCDQLSCIRFSTTLSRIGRSAFEGCTSLKEVEFPGSLTSIGNWGFYNCTGLSEVRLPDTLTTLGRNSFADCTNLSKINYPMSLSSAGESIFAGDSRLKSITVPDGVKKLPDSVFKNCTNFTEIILPESLKEIGGAALEGCTGLTAIRLPSGMTSIGNWGFYNCTGLTEIQLPDTLTKLGRNSFADCTNLNKLNYPKNLSSAGESIFDGDSRLKSITVPDGVEKLPDSVFKNCTNFTEIILPESLKEIGGAALEGCTGLAEIRLPSGLTSIGNWGFYNCTGLREVQLPDTITTLGKNSFANCTSLSSINYPKNLSSAGESIFDGDSKLKSITVPDGVEKLPDNMFKNCSRIRYINLPSTLKVIGASAFEGCKGLPSINIPQNVNNIGNYAFYGCTGLITITIPESITSLNRCVFANCSNLTKVYIPDSVKHIEDNTFEGSSGVVFYCSYNSYATIYAIDKKIPFISTGMREENQNSVLDQKNTSYYGDFNSMTSNGYVAMTMKYKIKDDMKNAVSGLAVEITLPSNAEFDESTLKVDGLLSTDYKYDGGRNLRIPLSNTEGVIRYSVKIKEQSDTTSSARIFYTCNGEQTNEIIGIINEAVSVFTIDAPEITSEETVYVSGVAPASSEIVLKIDGKTKKEIKASKAGLWSGSLQLENPVDYREYKIDAECKNSSLKPEAKVVYHEGEPSLTSFKMHYNEHNEIKTCDILNTDGVLPVVYYLPGTKFDYELSFKNADQIKEIYVTSTRNNETKYLKATYNEKKQAFVTDGYFDENNHNYVPGIISYEYNKPAKSATVGQEVDWDKLKNNLLEDTDKALKVTQNTASDYKATIDLSSLGKEFADVAIDAKISVFDENHGTDLGVWKGLMEENDTILSYILPGYDDKKYICNLDYSDAGTWYMLVKDVSGNKYIGLILDTAIDNSDNLDKTWDLIQVSSRLSAVNTAASMLYKNYQIETDMDQLRKDVMSSGGYSSNEELNKVLKSVDDLEYDQKMFMIMTTILPLVVAGPAVVGATMSAAPMILFTALLGAMTASSSFFWSVRKANIKGEKYKSKFIVDPSGYVYDQTTGERLENVTVTAYCIEYDESSDFWNKIPSAEAYGEKWNALEYNQQNPLLTNADGKYAWDVPEGWWRVKYEKEGYETAWSDWMTVPPLQTEVNIGLQPNGKVEKEHRWDKGTIQVRPTCTSTGIISYTCLDCGQTKTEVLATDSKNHGKLMTEPARKPTCLKAGRTEKIYCAMCKAVIKESRTINKLKATIRINVAGTLPLTVKQTFNVKVVAGTGDGVAFWKSSAPKIVSVKNGRIKGLKAGTATITVQLKSGLKKSFKVKVQKKAVATTSLKITDAVSGKKISKNITLKCKKSLRLKATVAPVTSRQKVIWSSSNKKVATVTSKGVITAKKKGKTIITVKSGKKTYKIKVTVK